MKRTFIYSLFFAMLILSFAIMGSASHLPISQLSKSADRPESLNDFYSQKSNTANADYYFTSSDCPFAASSIQQSRTSFNLNSIASRFTGNSFCFSIVRASLLTQENLSVARLLYTNHYSHIRSWGYYIYQLRKLLI